MDWVKKIAELKKQKNAIIMAHYYQDAAIQDIADYVGDSLALAQWAAKTDADIIVMCGVHFMGETAKILSPSKKVLVPDTAAGCSLADSCPADEFASFIKQHPNHTVISFRVSQASSLFCFFMFFLSQFIHVIFKELLCTWYKLSFSIWSY